MKLIDKAKDVNVMFEIKEKEYSGIVQIINLMMKFNVEERLEMEKAVKGLEEIAGIIGSEQKD